MLFYLNIAVRILCCFICTQLCVSYVVLFAHCCVYPMLFYLHTAVCILCCFICIQPCVSYVVLFAYSCVYSMLFYLHTAVFILRCLICIQLCVSCVALCHKQRNVSAVSYEKHTTVCVFLIASKSVRLDLLDFQMENRKQ